MTSLENYMAKALNDNASAKSTQDFAKLHEEWRAYHEGKVVHPTKGEEVSKAELRQFEISDIVEKEFNKIKGKIGKKRPTEEEIEPIVYELSEKSYLASVGLKDKKSVGDMDIFKQNVKNYFISIASRATGRSIETYEEAVKAILEATDPLYGGEGERSRILDALLQQYAAITHESEHEQTKGHRVSRLEYLQKELSNIRYKSLLEKEYKNIFEQYGRKGHEFDETAKSGDILDVAEHALTNDRILGHVLRRKYIVNPKGHLREEKPKYDKAA